MSFISCLIHQVAVRKRNFLNTMAPHPVVQAVIDLSAGAVGNYNVLANSITEYTMRNIYSLVK